MLAIILLPHIAVPLYFLIGIRKRRSDQDKAYIIFNRSKNATFTPTTDIKPLIHLLQKNGIPPPRSGNSFELICSGNVAYKHLIYEIEQATETIDLCTYVFKFDTMTRNLIDALTRKAREGVRIRLLIDLVGSMPASLHQKEFASLKNAGAQIQFFRPFTLKPFQNYLNLRNHRKIYLFDQKTVLSGGMNLSNEYMGEGNDAQRWQDLLYRMQGPCVEHFYLLFHNDWIYAGGEETDMRFLPTPTQGSETVQVIPSGPDIENDALYESLLELICTAKKRIWIVTPYFIPNETLMEALLMANGKGIDIKLITPRKSNHLLADLGRLPYMRALEDAGVDVKLYTGNMLHAKSILFDDTIAMVGSANFDNRSLFLNYEVVSFIYSSKQTQHLASWMENMMKDSIQGLQKPSKVREAGENIMKVFAAIL